MNSVKKVFVALIMTLVLTGYAGQARASSHPAIKTVETLHDVLLDVMKNADSLGVQGRYDKLKDPVNTAYNQKLMVRVIVGKKVWKSMSDDQRNELIAAFEHSSVSTYASQFDGFGGESFRTVGIKDGPQKTKLVSTEIVIPDDTPVGLTYVVRESKGQWRIVDVLLGNLASELSKKRSEYSSIIKSDGIDGLIKILNEKSASLLKG